MVSRLSAELAGLVREAYPHCRGLILTGSAARGEATIAFLPDRTEWLSDLELLAVVPDSTNLQVAAARLGRLAVQFAARQETRRVFLEVELTPAPEKYFARVRPHLFGYELKYCGRQLSGSIRYLERIPHFEPGQIPEEDAWRLVSNRMLEWLDFRLEGGGRSLPQQFYVLVKTCLDLVTSLSLLSGDYRPTYRTRCERLHSILAWARRARCPISSDWLRRGVAVSLAFKNNPRDGFEWLWRSPATELSQALHAQHLEELYAGLHRGLPVVWRWMATKISGDNGLVPPVYSFRTKLLGWMKLLLCTPPGGRLLIAGRMARLIRLGSPRSLVYSCAARLLDPDSGAAPDTLAWVRRRLPAPCPGYPGWEELARSCVTVWKQCLRQGYA